MIRALALLALALPGISEAACTVARGATVHLPDGPVEGSAVVIDAGRIVAVGPQGDTWQGRRCDVISGEVVTAGLVEVQTHLGLVEVGAVDATREHDAGESDPIRAAFRVADAYNPRSSLIPVARIAGITSAVVSPSGGRVSGQAAWVDLAGATRADALADPSVAVVASISGASPAEGLLRLRELLADARYFARSRAAWEQNRARDLVASGLDLEALQPVLAREVPLVIEADRASDIEALLTFAHDEQVDVVLIGGAEAWMLADALASAQVPVVVDPLIYGPGSFDQLHARPDNAALLHAAGVPVILSSSSSHNARTLPQMAGNAVRGGLDHAAAVQAITATPARVFGVEDRGTLEVGKVANVVVWSGDPLELSSRPTHVLIRGAAVPLISRQTELFERYRDGAGLPAALPLE